MVRTHRGIGGTVDLNQTKLHHFSTRLLLFYLPHCCPPPPPLFSLIPVLSLYPYCVRHFLTSSYFYIIFFLHHFNKAAISIKIIYLFVSVVLICLVLDLKKIILLKICIYCIVLVLLNCVLFNLVHFKHNYGYLEYKYSEIK